MYYFYEQVVISIKSIIKRSLCILLMFAMPMNPFGGACFAAEDSTPIEAPVDDGFFERGKSFFMYTISRMKDGVSGFFIKISGKKVAKYQDLTLDIGPEPEKEYELPIGDFNWTFRIKVDG